MAVLDAPSIVAAVESHAATLGVFERVVTSEPKNAPGNGPTCAIWLDQIGPVPAASGLSSESMRIVMMLRVMKPFLEQPYGAIDTDMMTAVDALMRSYSTGFTLGGLVRNVDLLGAHGVALAGRAGYVTIDRSVFRLVDITLPLIINDLWEEVA